MFHTWELALIEMCLPLVGYYWGQKLHWGFGIFLAALGLLWAEWTIFTVIKNGWLIQ